MPLQKFPRVYNKTNFGLTADVVCQPNIYTPVGTVTVPAGQFVTFGVGAVSNGVDTREVAYLQLANSSGTTLHGTVRLILSDANGIRKVVVAEQRTEKFNASQNDRTLGFLLGEYPTKVKEDSLLIIEFKPDGASAVTVSHSHANTSILMPVTVYQ